MQTKARSLLQTLKEHARKDNGQEFVPNTGWFKRFKKRFQFQNVQVTRKAVIADEEEADKLVDNRD